MLLFMDGQAHYGTAGLTAKWSSLDTLNCAWSVVPEGRFGANCIKRVSTNVNVGGSIGVAPLVTRTGPWSPKISGVAGFAVKCDDLSQIARNNLCIPDGHEFFTIMEGAVAHVGCILNPDGTLSLWRSRFSSGVTLLAVSAEGVQSGAWAFLEFKWLIDRTVGTFQIRANGVLIMDFIGNTHDSSGLDSALGVWNSVRIGATAFNGGPGSVVFRFNDVYVADLVQAVSQDVNDFLGDGTILTIRPNGVGASTDWAPFPAAPNWDQTNDVIQDDDATYAVATNVGLKDTYQFEDVPAGTVVKGAHMCIMARKETDGSAAVQPVVRQGGTDYPLQLQGVGSTNYDRYITQPVDVNPATLARFTAAEINAGQFGVVKVL